MRKSQIATYSHSLSICQARSAMKMIPSSSSGRSLIFVYGTLRRGFPNEHAMPSQLKYLGTAVTISRFPLVVGTVAQIPFLLDFPDHPGAFHVKGELYDASESDNIGTIFQHLDDFEGVADRFYKRQLIEVVTDDNDSDQQTVQAFCYLRDTGGPAWAWTAERMLQELKMVPEYSPDLASSYLPREDR